MANAFASNNLNSFLSLITYSSGCVLQSKSSREMKSFIDNPKFSKASSSLGSTSAG